MTRLSSLAVAFALALLAVGQPTQAGFNNFNGGIPLSFGTITTDTGNINTATSYTIAPTVYLGGASGDFLNYVPSFLINFTPIATSTTMAGINPNLPVNTLVSYTGLTFGSTAFGTFTSATYTMLQSAPQTESYEFFGTFATGTYFNSDPNAGSGAASFTVTFGQTSATTPISGSGVLNVPPTPLSVPEPASAAMLGLGLVGVAGFARRRMAK